MNLLMDNAFREMGVSSMFVEGLVLVNCCKTVTATQSISESTSLLIKYIEY